MGLLSLVGTGAGFFLGGPQGAALGGSLGAGFDQENANQQQQDWNAEQAQLSRNFQASQRATAYQTTVADLKAAGLNPMLAYGNGATNTPTSASASMGPLPPTSQATANFLNSAAQYAQIQKTQADTKVSEAMATKTNAETNLVTNSAENVKQNTENLKESIDQIRANIQLLKNQAYSEGFKPRLTSAQTELAEIQQKLESQKITLTEAQTMLTKVTARLQTLNIPEATNKANSQDTWWMKNIAPYLNSAGKVTDILGTGINMLK